MNTEKDLELANELSKLLMDVLMLRNSPEIPDHFKSIDCLQTLHANLVSLRDFVYAASNGDLSRPVPFKGYIGGALKTLQANLKHMTWQTKMIASGDFTQRVDFMGEFSQSFNAMVIQLDQTLEEIASKENELRNANDRLLKEITRREQTEAALRKSEEAFRHIAITDSLTGLYNRGHLNQLALNEISRVLRYSRPLSVIMLDIDFFKHVNDTYGHAAGDLVLQAVASITKSHVRVSDIVARYGGEEFIILLPETIAADAADVAENLRWRIEDSSVDGGKYLIRITASFGVSDYLEKSDAEPDDKIVSGFVSKADLALYESKKAGRNRVTIYKPEQEPGPLVL